MSPQGTWQGRGERRQRRGKWVTEERLPSVASDRRECSLARQGKLISGVSVPSSLVLRKLFGELETVSPSWTACFGLLPTARKAWPTMNPFFVVRRAFGTRLPFHARRCGLVAVVWRMANPGSISLSRWMRMPHGSGLTGVPRSGGASGSFGRGCHCGIADRRAAAPAWINASDAVRGRSEERSS